MEPLDLKLLRLNTFNYSPKRIISLVAPSRSGSSIIKHALSLHPEITSLAGEEEPYYKLAGNGYPHHQSDEFHTVNESGLVRLLIANEVHNHESKFNRNLLQSYLVEEPPFVQPIVCRQTDTLLLKTPQNCYRRGVLEQLYPDAEIIYLVIQRQPEGVVNGLLDGWQTNGMFTARYLGHGRWWKFDMPPNWNLDATLLEICINQWRQANLFISRCYSDAIGIIYYESFLKEWKETVMEVWDELGLGHYSIPDDVSFLPWIGVTDPDGAERWKEKRPWLVECLTISNGS